MADARISDLTAVTDVLSTDQYVLARSGNTRKIAGSDLKTMMPGAEVAYTEFSPAAQSITATSEPTSQLIVTASAFTADGTSVYLIDVYVPQVQLTAVNYINFPLYVDGTLIASLGVYQNNAAVNSSTPLYLSRRLTPASGSRTYSVRAYLNTGTAYIYAGGGIPGYIRIVRV